MQKLYNILSLQNVLPRPLGLVRYWIFILSFLISRIPLWFVLFSAVLYTGSINIIQGLFIMAAILICRTFVESEMAGGEKAFSFFAILRILRGAYAVVIYFVIVGFLIYVFHPENNDTFGKITIFLSLIIIPFLIKSKSNITYHHGYYTGRLLSCIITFLWFYLGFLPDTFMMNIIIILLIYTLEFYNLIYKKPLGIMPNQSSMQALHQ